jgi:hypothetical protein
MAIGPAAFSAGLKLRALVGEPISSSPTFLRRSEEVIRAIQSLPAHQNMVLFSPVVAPLYPVQPNEHPIDPFEPLGRALSHHHQRIQHVPFVPSAGATETHRIFFKQAGAAVVVVCDSANASTTRRLNLLDQIGFAESMQRLAASLEESAVSPASGAPSVPSLILLVIIERHRLPDVAHEMAQFETVLHCESYGVDALQRAADAIFQRSAATAADPGAGRSEDDPI